MKHRIVKNNEFVFWDVSGDRSAEVLNLIICKVIRIFSNLCKEILAVVPDDYSKPDVAVNDEYTEEEIITKTSSAVERQSRAVDNKTIR